MRLNQNEHPQNPIVQSATPSLGSTSSVIVGPANCFTTIIIAAFEPLRARGSALRAAVAVIKPHDVVFAEIRARLHLDDLERDGAGIGESMNFPKGDEG